MKKTMIKKIAAATAVFAFILVTACGISKPDEGAASQQGAEAPYFSKGVYFCQDEESFYVFYDEKTGRTELTDGIGGLPFRCEQENGKVTFHMGDEADESARILTVKSGEDGTVTGAFEDGEELTFTLEKSADPDDFDALTYTSVAFFN